MQLIKIYRLVNRRLIYNFKFNLNQLKYKNCAFKLMIDPEKIISIPESERWLF